jgi:hypothetical protein
MLNVNMNLFQNNNNNNNSIIFNNQFFNNNSLNNSIVNINNNNSHINNNNNNNNNNNLLNEMSISHSSLNGISAINANINTNLNPNIPYKNLTTSDNRIKIPLKNNPDSSTKFPLMNSDKQHKPQSQIMNKEIYNCRICFRSDSDYEDPLVSPCKCAGSIGYIHYKCLKQCINVKLNTKIGDNCMTFIWKNFECEICLAEYPKYIRYKNTCYYLVDLNLFYEQYIIFDYTLYDDTKKRSVRKGIIVVSVNDDEDITVGRTQTNTIKLKDISVSRNHCTIFKKDNKVFINDKGSKFGTLAYLNKPFVLCEKSKENEKLNSNSLFDEMNHFYGSNLDLVTGKNHMNFNANKNWSLFSNIFYSAMCCNYKKENQNEFILDHEEIVCKNENFPIKANSANTIFNNGIDPRLLYDSYCDHILNLDTIIRHSEQDE